MVGGGQVYNSFFSWNVDAVLRGQVWRLFTFLLNPPTTSLLMLMLICFIYWNMGRMLERLIGTFYFNLYMFSGIIFQIIGGILAYILTKQNINMGTTYLNLSMFFAIVFLFPDMQFYIFYGLIPMKGKWVAIMEAVLFGVLFFTGGLGTKIEIVFSLLNVINFFFLTHNNRGRFSPKQIRRRRQYQKRVHEVVKMTPYRHKCAVCGRTELDGENLEFRYCSKCAGSYEYCMDHLYTHIHVTEPTPQNNHTNLK